MLAALGVGGFGLALAPRVVGGRAQDASMAEHPIVGAWLALEVLPSAPDVTIAVTTIAFPDGTVISSYPVTEMVPRGIMHKSPLLGVWEPVDQRRSHMTKVLSLASPDGAFMGTLTYDVYQEVSEDGQTYMGQQPGNLVTVRDASNVILTEFPADALQLGTGYRITPGNVPLPDSASRATPAV
jgi:hypothetical protein